MSDKKIIAVIGSTGAQGGGLVRAILADPERRFTARAITRRTDSDKARALAAAGAEVVAGDADDPVSLERAFAGALGVFAVTNFWEHLSAERELKQAMAMARATKAAGVAHAVWSTLEDTRHSFPLDDPRLKTLRGKYKVPHFDAKGEADAVFAAEGAPTSYLMSAFYWENFIFFGQGPRRGADGRRRPRVAARRGQAAGDRGRGHRKMRIRDLPARAEGGRAAVRHRRRDTLGPGVCRCVRASPRGAGLVLRHPVRRLPGARLPGRGRHGEHVRAPLHIGRRIPASPLARGCARVEPGAPDVRPLAPRERIAHPAQLRPRVQFPAGDEATSGPTGRPSSPRSCAG